MERLTKFVTPVGMCMTSLNSMKHYMPCVPCRHKAELKTDSKGKQYTEKFSFCDTCEVKMLFNRLKEYEDLEEQGLLLRLPCKVGDTVYILAGRFGTFYEEDICDGFYIGRDGILQVKVQNHKGNHGTYGVVGKTVFLTKAEAEKALADMEKNNG